jgi:hypothetical protein
MGLVPSYPPVIHRIVTLDVARRKSARQTGRAMQTLGVEISRIAIIIIS